MIAQFWSGDEWSSQIATLTCSFKGVRYYGVVDELNNNQDKIIHESFRLFLCVYVCINNFINKKGSSIKSEEQLFESIEFNNIKCVYKIITHNLLDL